MGKKLYVGGLAYSTSQDGLKNYFSQAGAVDSATIIMDKMSGRSKGFGFVEMASDEDAQKAIEQFNDKEFEGRRLTVNEARPQEKRPRFDGGGGGGYGGGGGGYGGGGGGYGGGGGGGGRGDRGGGRGGYGGGGGGGGGGRDRGDRKRRDW